MGETEITRTQFLSIMGNDPSDTDYSSGATDPVQMVNWYHAIAFCNKLSLKEGLKPVYEVTGISFDTLSFNMIPTEQDHYWDAVTANWKANGYRLPTEMEWMWAYMGATDTRNKAFAGNSGTNTIGDCVWYEENSKGKTHPVGSKKSNELGLFDMSGNVFEWCWDGSTEELQETFSEYKVKGTAIDYRGADSGNYRLIRGSSYDVESLYSNLKIGMFIEPNFKFEGLGFRVIRP